MWLGIPILYCIQTWWRRDPVVRRGFCGRNMTVVGPGGKLWATVPSVTDQSPRSTRNRLDFPEELGPITRMLFPRTTSRVRSVCVCMGWRVIVTQNLKAKDLSGLKSNKPQYWKTQDIIIYLTLYIQLKVCLAGRLSLKVCRIIQISYVKSNLVNLTQS